MNRCYYKILSDTNYNSYIGVCVNVYFAIGVCKVL